MKVDVKKLDKNKVEISVEIPPLLAESYFKTAVEELSKDLRIKGFRPGKAPFEIAEREIGSQKIYDQTANIALQRTLPKIILDEELEVVGHPEIIVKKIAKGDVLIYQAIFQLMPKVELTNYKGLEVKKNEPRVEEEEIKKSLDYLQNSRTKIITVNRPAKKGDRVEIDFEVRQNNVKIEDGENKNHPLILGESRFLPGFEKELEEMEAGEEKEFSIKTPENWPDKRIAGKNLDFKVKMNLVQERELPKIDDDFAKSLGHFNLLTELKKSIEEGLIKEKEEKEKQKIKMDLIEQVAKDSKMEVPEVLINDEIEKMFNDFENNLVNMRLELDTYLNKIKKSVDDIKKEWREQAEKRVRIGLCLKAIIDKENINVSDNEIEERVNEDLKQYPNTEEVKKKIDLNQLKEYTRNILKNEKVFELLEREAIIT